MSGIERGVARRDRTIDSDPGALATWALDPLPEGRTRMHIASVFDVTKPGGAETVRDVVEAVDGMIFKGLSDYFAVQKIAARGVR